MPLCGPMPQEAKTIIVQILSGLRYLNVGDPAVGSHGSNTRFQHWQVAMPCVVAVPPLVNNDRQVQLRSPLVTAES